MGNIFRICRRKDAQDQERLDKASEAGEESRRGSEEFGERKGNERLSIKHNVEDHDKGDGEKQLRLPSSRDLSGPKSVKIVLVGDTSVGKSCLITNYLFNTFSEDFFEPTVLEVYRGTNNVMKRQILLEIHDTSGDDSLGINRQVQYNRSDIFMICVAANSNDSFESIDKWAREIR